jgi:hypothetical protein
MRLRLWCALLVGAAMSAIPAVTVAAEGSVGPHYGQASCYGTETGGWQMVVSAPQIFSSTPRSNPGVVIVGSQHNQVVAYKVNIFYSTDAINWQFSATSSWRAAWVGDGVNAPLPPSSWYDYDSAQWVSNVLTWNLNSSGYFRAAVQFYWFADSVSDAGSDYLWAEHFSYDTEFGGALAYCTVP